MNNIWIWFSTGFTHIADWAGYDHILFVSLLVFAFPFDQWKRLLLLITAFTVGHSVSLALSVTGVWQAPRLLTELLIAITILSSAVYQLLMLKKPQNQKFTILYIVVCLFGLIHGLGFSYFLTSMLGKEESVLLPLLYFNLGLEAGQIFIVGLVVLFSLLLTLIFKTTFKTNKQITVCIIALVALKLCAERSLELYQSC